eukprot:COSAG06_NODE_739_length_12671_cov_28.300907_9_plen_104_part_00
MNMTQKQLTAAFNQCRQSDLGKHSFVMYEQDAPPGRPPCRIDACEKFDIDLLLSAGPPRGAYCCPRARRAGQPSIASRKKALSGRVTPLLSKSGCIFSPQEFA